MFDEINEVVVVVFERVEVRGLEERKGEIL